MASIDFEELEEKIGYKFKDKSLLITALTHSSYAYENIKKNAMHNEKLEFLGDSVLNFIVVDYILKTFSNLSEGDLSKLKSSGISTPSLSKFAKEIKLGDYILLSKGEILSGGKRKDKILAGAFEALIGAIYLDGGITKAKRFVKKFIIPFYKELKGKPFIVDNYKSALQEFYQKKNLHPPTYRVIEEKGPEHNKIFKVEVIWGGKSLAQATGKSKKSAEQRAAKKVLKKIIGKDIKDLVAETFFVEKKVDE